MHYHDDVDVTEERRGPIGWVKGFFGRGDDETEFEDEPSIMTPKVRRVHPYEVHVHKDLQELADARSAADGLKSGSQQILNLSLTAPHERERIVDFMSGVVYTLEGTVEKIGENVFLYAPHEAVVRITGQITKAPDYLG